MKIMIIIISAYLMRIMLVETCVLPEVAYRLRLKKQFILEHIIQQTAR
jgi:hypothetical protein